MGLKFLLATLLTLVSIFTVLGQSPPPNQNADSICSTLQTEIQILDSRLSRINSRLSYADSIQKVTLNEVTRDTRWEDVKTNLVASFIYDILGFNGNTTGSIIAKILSALYLVYICLKARSWWRAFKQKGVGMKVLDVFGGVIVCLQAVFSLFVFFASFLFSNNDILYKTAFNEANNSIKVLNKEIENLREVDFVALSENLKIFQQLKMDTLRVTDISYLNSLEKTLTKSDSTFKARLEVIGRKVDSVQHEVKAITPPTNFATDGWQCIQTIMLILISVGIFYIFKRNG